MIATLLIVLALSQQQQQQTATATATVDADLRSPAGQGRGREEERHRAIRGKITNTEGRPLRRVQLRLSGDSIPEGRTSSTNGLGKFEIRDLPAGRYTLFASRAGYSPCGSARRG
jgi:hypothetical protein